MEAMSSAAGYISTASTDPGAAGARSAVISSCARITALMEQEGAGILRLLRRILGAEADVLDAYQDCFCKLATAGRPEEWRNVRAYLYRTASNIAIEMLRSRTRRRQHLPAIAGGKPSEVERVDGAADGENLEALRAAIAKLPNHLQQVIVLRDLGQLAYEEVGRTLGIDPATARVYRRHAVLKLAELMGGEESS